MDGPEQTVLSAHTARLCRGVSSITMLLIHLQAYVSIDRSPIAAAVTVFQSDDVNDVKTMRTDTEKVTRMIELLKSRPRGFQALCVALRETSQPWLADALEEDLAAERAEDAQRQASAAAERATQRRNAQAGAAEQRKNSLLVTSDSGASVHTLSDLSTGPSSEGQDESLAIHSPTNSDFPDRPAH